MIKAILFDISGVLYIDRQPIAGAVELIKTLRQSSIPMRFVTNTSRSTSQSVFAELTRMGFDIKPEEVFTAPVAIKSLCQAKGYRPFCLIHPDLMPEFSDLDQSRPNAVIVTDAAELFNYQQLNQAFSLLMDGAVLLGIGRNRYFKSAGQLQLDAGPFIQALEYAADVKAQIIGKPDASFFQAAVSSLNVRPDEVLMIGDDVASDVVGAINAGLQACLVRTGKFLPQDEKEAKSANALIADSVVEAVNQAFDLEY
ncbi:TIGR01458 family HAD-type hydrolase [Methylophaga sulfidovorans]|uniref:Phospholysine phosphohistidine inorganic pyrophosphate phosphatase n=1 Tax=Methylophaga sulfidovorans TaxID=45496 RepID=A0A1I3VU09_9GAMM|nr:TIGR01458 family HAD-type hydrolase [Methylophaga sulfidovorans]SFJ97766.1 HAD-superfamily subfamily IIA hydrolase, TIGR01458 [Methylophaga sulfidovorans]